MAGDPRHAPHVDADHRQDAAGARAPAESLVARPVVPDVPGADDDSDAIRVASRARSVLSGRGRAGVLPERVRRAGHAGAVGSRGAGPATGRMALTGGPTSSPRSDRMPRIIDMECSVPYGANAAAKAAEPEPAAAPVPAQPGYGMANYGRIFRSRREGADHRPAGDLDAYIKQLATLGIVRSLPLD